MTDQNHNQRTDQKHLDKYIKYKYLDKGSNQYQPVINILSYKQ